MLALALLLGCPAHEGPIDVILIDIPAAEATIEWTVAGEDAWQVCTNGTTDPDAVVGCGPYGAGDPGDYSVRVTWDGLQAVQDVTLERDGSYEANVALTFEPGDFPTP